MSLMDHEELRHQVEELPDKGFIQEHLNPCTVPAWLTLKKYNSWRICMDSQAINKIIVQYHFPIPQLDDSLDHISKATVFAKLDLKSGHYHIRIWHGEKKWKTPFKTHEGLY